jgi:hypothetical protein
MFVLSRPLVAFDLALEKTSEGNVRLRTAESA